MTGEPAEVTRASRLADRLFSGVVGTGALGVLVIARYLDPSGDGHGTHRQLGLPGCSFLEWTGLPCPMCGATTTFALMADLHWVSGVVNQPFAALLFLLTVMVAAVGLVELVWPRGRWTRLGQRIQPYEGKVALGIFALLIIGWTYKILVMRNFIG